MELVQVFPMNETAHWVSFELNKNCSCFTFVCAGLYINRKVQEFKNKSKSENWFSYSLNERMKLGIIQIHVASEGWSLTTELSFACATDTQHPPRDSAKVEALVFCKTF